MLSIAAAALVAAWLPFTVFYVNAIQPQPVVRVTGSTNGHGVVVTRTSAGQVVTQSGSSPAVSAPAAVPVTSRSS